MLAPARSPILFPGTPPSSPAGISPTRWSRRASHAEVLLEPEEFVRVAELSEIREGLGRVVEVDGKLVALFRIGDEVLAIDNECPHRGGPLGDGTLEGDVLTCPWHEWKFHLRTGRAVHAVIIKVPTYRVKVEEGAVLVSRPAVSDPSAPPERA